jgi:hypothetical protein
LEAGSEHRDAALGSPALFLCPSVDARLERCRNAVSEEGFAKSSKKVAADPDCHLRACALKCEASGFGIVTKDQQFLKFDAAGNASIVEALKTSDKKDHLRVDVSGDVQGDTLKVTSIKLL